MPSHVHCMHNAGGSPCNNRSVRFHLTHTTLLGNVNNPAMPPKKKGGKKKKGKKKDGEISLSLATAYVDCDKFKDIQCLGVIR